MGTVPVDSLLRPNIPFYIVGVASAFRMISLTPAAFVAWDSNAMTAPVALILRGIRSRKLGGYPSQPILFTFPDKKGFPGRVGVAFLGVPGRSVEEQLMPSRLNDKSHAGDSTC